ncbi:OmpH family outer membrane protein [Candidatus Pelagibacter sp.]|nr:OmpH family outer membrane protein [Candidatus Pelagibacter sp.]
MFYKKLLKYLFFFISIFYSSFAYSSEKIYYLDMDYLMNNSQAGKSIITQLEKKRELNLVSFSKTEKDLKEEEAKIISQKNILNQTEFEKKVQLFNQKVSTYRKKRNDTITDLSKKRVEAQKVLLNTLTPILADYSQKNSISYIIPKQNIIIGKSDLDITKIILEILDSKVKNIKLK